MSVSHLAESHLFVSRSQPYVCSGQPAGQPVDYNRTVVSILIVFRDQPVAPIFVAGGLLPRPQQHLKI